MPSVSNLGEADTSVEEALFAVGTTEAPSSVAAWPRPGPSRRRERQAELADLAGE
jgi:hypothetical protein